jgi:hypothetical protein
MYYTDLINTKLPGWLHLPRGRTLPCAVGVILAVFGVQMALLSIVPKRDAQFAKRTASSSPRGIEPEFSTGESLLIQPRLGAPSLRAGWQELVEESRAAAAKGDSDLAVKLLEEAESQAPQQPAALAEVAVQMEKCSAPGRALKLWERVHQFGISAGIYYSAADAKLNLIQAKKADESNGSSTAGAKTAPLKFAKLVLKEHAGSSPNRRNFTLEVPVQRGGNNRIEVRDVSVQVQFYDQLNARTLERTNAAIRWKWASAPVDWTDDSTETLEVEYHQATNRSNGEERRFFGYVASVYYKDKLLDMRADPPRLGQQYPPPRLLARDAAP